MSRILLTFQQSSWLQRLFALVLICNMVLILWGIHIIPASFTLDGIARIVAILGLQTVITLLAVFGPVSFQRLRSSIGVSVLFGVLFAIAYDGVVLLDFVGITLDVNIWLLFVSAASLAGFIAGYQTRQFGQGMLAAIWTLVIGTALWSIGILIGNYVFWGTHDWYLFWLHDGAIDDFQHSGMSDLNLFLIQDIQGALFFHPLLSAALGAMCGLIASGLAQGVLWCQRTLNTRFNLR